MTANSIRAAHGVHGASSRGDSTDQAGTLRLLGAFQLEHNSVPVTLGQPRLEELVARLAVHPGTTVTRRQLAFQFWPDSSERQAHTNVRNLLHKLKKSWPDLESAIAIERSGITWRNDADIAVDVQRFSALHQRVTQALDDATRAARAAEAASLYRGDLLPDCYADWALAERARLRDDFATVVEVLIDELVDARRYREALTWATRMVEHDPLMESSYRRLMQLHGLVNDRAAALRAFQTCATRLEQELGVKPSRATLALHAQLLHHEPVPTDRDPEPQQIARPELVGRHPEWKVLRQAWSDTQTGRAQCVLIWGEAGIGKSRLAQELVDWARRQGHAWAASRSYAAKGALSYAPVTTWLRAPAVIGSLDTLDDLWRVELARLLPELLAARPDLPQPGPLAENWQQQRFFHGITHALQAVPGPLLLLLDDLQWSDEENLSLLQYILHNARRHPLMLVATVRTEDALGNQPLAAFVDSLRHMQQLTELRLGPLSPDETAALAAQTAGTALDHGVSQALYEESEGHPLYLVEAIQMGLQHEADSAPSHLPHAVPVTREDGMNIPPKIYAVIASRLGQLTDLAQQVATVAAVMGRAFAYPVLRTVMELDELRLVDALDELWQRRIIREQNADRYDFSHDRIREVAYGETSRARRRLLHRKIAHALEAHHEGDPDEIAGEVATHYAAAGESAAAFTHYRRAARLAMAQHAVAQATYLFDQALAFAPNDVGTRVELLNEQNRALEAAMDFTRWRTNIDAQDALLQAHAEPDPRLRLMVLLSRSEYFTYRGAGADAVAAGSEAVKLAGQVDDQSARARAYQHMADGYWVQSDMAKAAHYFERASDHARAARDEVTEGRCLEREAQTGMFAGMATDAIRARLDRAFALARKQDDALRLASLYNKFGYLPMQVGMGGFAEAEADYQRGLAEARKIHSASLQQTILSNLGVLYTKQGEYRRAFAAFAECFDIAQTKPGFWRHSVEFGYVGRLLLQMGALDLARAVLMQASDHLEVLQNHHFQVIVRCDLGLVHQLAGDFAAARAELTQVLQLILGYGDVRFEALVNTRLGYALESLGETERAATAYGRGYDFHRQMSQAYHALDALAGLARLARTRDAQAEALTHATTIWDTIAGKAMEATVETTRTLRTCYEIFQSAGDPRAAEVRAMALAQLRARGASIDDAAHRAHFRDLADHRFFLEMVDSEENAKAETRRNGSA